MSPAAADTRQLSEDQLPARDVGLVRPQLRTRTRNGLEWLRMSFGSGPRQSKPESNRST